MEMIERYIYAVTHRLPQSQREDIAVELRGLIEDMLEEQVRGNQVTDSDVEAVLLELGNPKELSEKYRGKKNYLIGPELYDSYMTVLKIALIAVAAVVCLEFVINSMIEPMSILDHFVGFIVSTVTALPTVLGWTTFGFAMAEKFDETNSKKLDPSKEWKPANLAPVPDEKKRIKQYEPILGIAIYMFFIAVIVFSNEYLGIWIFNDEFSGIVPVLNKETHTTYLLFIILILSLGILKEILKLVYRKWSYKLVTTTLIVNLASFLVVLFVINGSGFWNPNFLAELTQAGIITEGSEAYGTVNYIWENISVWILVVFAVGLIWEAIDGWIKSARK